MFDNFFPYASFFFGWLIFVFVILMLAVYVYSSLALMTIAKKTKTKNPWLAWIPVGNVYLTTQIAKISGFWTFAILLGFVPFIGTLILTGLAVWWWWLIAERRKFPGWFGILMLVPVVNFVAMGVIAWGKK